MQHLSIYNLLHKMDEDNIILAYKGEINTELLESVYTMMDKHMEEKKTSPGIKKKFYYILIEALQNVFHHQVSLHSEKNDFGMTGFVIKSKRDNEYNIITGNYLLNSGVHTLKEKLDEINSLSPEALRNQYQQSLAGNNYSDKGGAGLGLIEMARKSGKKLNYEFTNVNDKYSFFSLAITIP